VGTVVGRFQMGGEGAMWNGMSPFVATTHFFQNLGDGTLAHSGTLAIRAAVASKVNITFKLLVNSTVAMTGGQPIAGGHDVATLVTQLLAEGVEKIIVTSDEPRRERVKRLPMGVEVWPRRRIVEAQEVLAGIAGVTVLLHDQECAAELRRKRKRGRIAAPRERVHVNTRLCEDCGDCGAVSNCLSVRRVDTPFGTKTQIHQESCNLDFTCLEADCPALVTVRPRPSPPARNREMITDLEELEDPTPLVDPESFTIRLTGIGGTGVLTVAQVIAMAAHLEGWHVRELDQTGIAQKGGAVVSDLRLSRRCVETAPRLGDGECDLYLGCDVLVAATTQYLSAASAARTIAVTSTSVVPTGRQVADRDIVSVPLDVMRSRIDGRSRTDLNVWLDAQTLARGKLGSDTYANVVLLGAAFQLGALALSGRAIERAIELNGVDVEANQLAFRLGRQVVTSPADASIDESELTARRVESDSRLEPIMTSIGATPGGELDFLVRVRVGDLTLYQDRTYARRFALVVRRAREAERRLGLTDEAFSRVAAVQLHRLMAYKDEYEVGRLHLSGESRSEVERAFGTGTRVTYHLRPPWLGTLGFRRKLRLSSSARKGFRILRAARFLRGTSLDPFGHSSMRREEREIRDEYITMIGRLSDALTRENYEHATEVASLPAMVRGFGSHKSSSIQRYRERLMAMAEGV
jgi:indolepyruvate ferredoxin oxidoreductase